VNTGKFAVVTGGSSGIGLELARKFANSGYDVLIASENADQLTNVAGQLGAPGRRVEIHVADLAEQDGVQSLYEAITGLSQPVDVLCVNAGIGVGNAFVDTDLATELKIIDLNCRGAVQLTKLVLKEMVARDSGKLLFTSSIDATMPDPFEAVYGASKAFLRWFGEGLREELKDTGVDVTVLMPGVTETAFFERADMLDTNAGASKHKDDPADAAAAAYDALMAGKDKVVPTIKNKVLAAVAEMLPDPLAPKAHRAMSEPGAGKG